MDNDSAPYGMYGKANNLDLYIGSLEGGDLKWDRVGRATGVTVRFRERPHVSPLLVMEAVAYTYNARCRRA